MPSVHSTLAVAFLSAGLVACQAAPAPPAEFSPAPNPRGRGGGAVKDSAHFRVTGAPDDRATKAIAQLEAAYGCFVDTLGWRSTGLSFNDAANDGPWYKTNVYQVTDLGGAAGAMSADGTTGLGFLNALPDFVDNAGVMVHEFGHVMTYHEQTWVDQGNTGAWWETVANFVADTYQTSPLCAAARAANNQPTATATNINLDKLISNSFRVLVDGSQGTGNYYEAWPFLTYLTNNPDGFPNLGNDTLRQMFRQYKPRSNETPLHALERLAAAGNGPSLQRIVGRYWARMAFVDIGHAPAARAFAQRRATLNYANLDPAGAAGSWRVKAARRPFYMGANIIPLKNPAGTVEARVQTVSPGKMTATLAVRDPAGTTRYVDLVGGVGDATARVEVAAGEEVMLVVANTPEVLMYNGFELPGSQALWGLDYSITVTGATA
ncbi:hypothetical protein CAC42_7141 [Sphaceloma murrayae]|uniref:Uncharacterized protein n=1 Tax=Sphaceloma murrayae TaxID=2082308 RepID=A0A2K1QQU8_9PEZI|nr:hypothetical protein CAC42_7141 [Sphaceloma murrayae]